MADHVGKRDRGFLAPGRSIGLDTDGGDAARIDDAADAGDARRNQDIARPFSSFDLRKDLRLIAALTRTLR